MPTSDQLPLQLPTIEELARLLAAAHSGSALAITAVRALNTVVAEALDTLDVMSVATAADDFVERERYLDTVACLNVVAHGEPIAACHCPCKTCVDATRAKASAEFLVGEFARLDAAFAKLAAEGRRP